MAVLRDLCVFLVAISSSIAKQAPLYGSQNDIKAIKDEYLVVFQKNPSVNCTEAVRTMSALWALQNKEMQVLHSYHINGMESTHIRADQDTLKSLREMPDVLLVETNQQVKMADFDPPQDNLTTTEPDLPEQCVRQYPGSKLWSLSRINSRAKPNFNSAGYDYSPTDDGSGVDVYIVDSGVFVKHEEFESRAVHGMTTYDLQVSEGDDDLNGHGTHVAGIVAGRQYGVAKNANIIAVKVLNYDGSGSVSGVIEGIQWTVNRELEKPADSRRSVLNLSLGTSGVVHSLDAAIEEAVAAGINVVVAAGNDNMDSCSVSPAHVSTAVSVGATDSSDRMSSFSNHGLCVDIMAPGQSVLSAYIGHSSMSHVLSGTSQASPHVAGIIARHLSALAPGTSLLPAQVLEYISETATKGQVSLQSSQAATPNLLLYKECSGLPVNGNAPNGQERCAGSRREIVFLLFSLLIVLLC